jgi:hypothetical protein
VSEPYETEMVEYAAKPCPFCGQVAIVTVDVAGLEKFLAGARLSEAFPRMPMDVREMFISGCCPDCWERHIKPSEDEDF